jgi:hypothetical protein
MNTKRDGPNSKKFGEYIGFSYANQLWKISFLLNEMGTYLFVFVRHLYTYGSISELIRIKIIIFPKHKIEKNSPKF